MSGTNDFTSGYADVNGLKMYYEIHGKGEPLVLIHGGGSTIGTSFGRILPMLKKDHKVIALELQAHGRTSDRDSPESFEQDADDVVALVRNIQIQKASFFGFSNGANTAMQIAIRHPEVANKLVLASGFYKKEGLLPGFFEGLEHATLEVMPKVLRDAFLELTPDNDKLQTMFNKDRQRMAGFSDWEDDMLRSIKAPTLIISGDQDIMVPSHAAAMSKLIAGSRLLILPATHGSFIGVAEIPDVDTAVMDLTVLVIKNFLNGQ